MGLLTLALGEERNSDGFRETERETESAGVGRQKESGGIVGKQRNTHTERIRKGVVKRRKIEKQSQDRGEETKMGKMAPPCEFLVSPHL